MRKNESVSEVVLDAILSSTWRDPGPAALRQILGESSDLELFSTEEAMEQVKNQVESGGYVDDPEFCMVRSSSAVLPTDNRLVFDRAMFIAGSVDPGDDVFIVVDGNTVKAFDWRKAAPDRWVEVGSVDELVEAIASVGG